MLSLTVSRMCQRGMFLDGVTYAAIARNMAAGIGDFWSPSLQPDDLSALRRAPAAGARPAGAGLHAVRGSPRGRARLCDHRLPAERSADRGHRATPAAAGLRLGAAAALDGAVGRHLERRQQPARDHAGGVHEPRLLRRPSHRAAGQPPDERGLGGIAAASSWPRRWRRGRSACSQSRCRCCCRSRPGRRGRRSPPSSGRCSLVCLSRPRRASRFRAIAAGAPAFVESQLAPALAGSRGGGQRGANALRHVGSGIGLRLAIVVVAIRLVLRRRTFPYGQAAVFLFAIAVAASAPIGISPLVAGHYFFPSTIFFALGAAALVIPAPARAAARGSAARVADLAVVRPRGGHSNHAHRPRAHRAARSRDAAEPRRDSAVRARGDTVGLPRLRDPLGIAELPAAVPSPLNRGGRHRGPAVVRAGARRLVPPPGCAPVVDAPSFRWLRCATGARPMWAGAR